MKEKLAQKIIEENKQSYDAIASDFDMTRQTAWPEFELLKEYLKPDCKLLDIGCGNGRLYKFLCAISDIAHYTGVDQSVALKNIAKQQCAISDIAHKADFIVANVLDLPFENNEFDLVAGIAFLHHIPSQELRLKVLKEIYRVLKPGGVLFMTNWNLWQWKLVRKYKLRIWDFFRKHNNMDAGDFWISFKGVPRYYHHFGKKELIGLCREAGFKFLKYEKGRNNIMIVEK